MPLIAVTHPLLDDALARLRDVATPCDEFRRLARRVSLLLIVEATRDLPLRQTLVRTPLEQTPARMVGTPVVAVPVLRSGIGMLDAFLELVPSAQVGYLGLERNEQTAVARRYYEKMPADLGKAVVFLLDPMLATGGSAVMALEGLRVLGASSMRLVCIVAAPEGVKAVEERFPDVEVYAAVVDRQLNDRMYILPGLGDFGDRLFGT